MTDTTAPSNSVTTDLGTSRVKRGLAEMLKGGVIMDVVTAEQAKMHELLTVAPDAGVITDSGVVHTEHLKGDYIWDGSALWSFFSWGPTTEYIENGGFESLISAGPPANWTTWLESAGTGAIEDSATTHGGTHAAKLTRGATDTTYIYQNLTTMTVGVTHPLTFWTRGDGTNAGRYYVYDVTNSAYIIALTSTGVTGATYTQVSTSFVVPAGCTSVYVGFMPPNGNTQFAYFDDVSVVNT